MTQVEFHPHDHDHCVEDRISRVDDVCKQKGLKLTPARRNVLEILLRDHRALGAYEILGGLKAKGRAAQPPVAYRALDFLVSHGFAHKIEHKNAFVACAHPDTAHAPAFLICESCDVVAEATPQVDLSQIADGGFEVASVMVEVKGLCPTCKSEPAQ